MTIKAQKLSDNLFIVMSELSNGEIHYVIRPKEDIENCEEIVFVADPEPGL